MAPQKHISRPHVLLKSVRAVMHRNTPHTAEAVLRLPAQC